MKANEERIAAVKAAREAGWTMTRIAADINTSVSNLSCILKRGGPNTKYGPILDAWLRAHDYWPGSPGLHLSATADVSDLHARAQRLLAEVSDGRALSLDDCATLHEARDALEAAENAIMSALGDRRRVVLDYIARWEAQCDSAVAAESRGKYKAK